VGLRVGIKGRKQWGSVSIGIGIGMKRFGYGTGKLIRGGGDWEEGIWL